MVMVVSLAEGVRTHHRRVIEYLALLGVFVCLLQLAEYADLPDQVPRHFNHVGVADGWGHKSVLFLLPILGVFQYGLLTVLGFAVSREVQGRNPALLLALLKLEIVWLFAYIEWRTILVAREMAEGLGILFLPILLTVVLGTVLWQVLHLRRAAPDDEPDDAQA